MGINLPGKYVVCALRTAQPDPLKTQMPAWDLIRVEDGSTGQSFCLEGENEEDLAAALKFINDAKVVTVRGASDLPCFFTTLWPGAFCSLSELSFLMLPGIPFRCGELAEELHLGNTRDDRFYAQVLIELGNRLGDLEIKTLTTLVKFLSRCGSPWAVHVDELAHHKVRTFDERPLRAKRAAVWYGPRIRENQGGSENIPLEEERILSFLSGPVAEQLQSYERRPQQEDMVRDIVNALNGKKCLVMEGATGTGKSMAYLLPAVFWALANREKVLVATHTINLQEQLWQKDIPVLKGAGLSFKAALVKGKQNYLCLLRWHEALKNDSCMPEEAFVYARILVWLEQTLTGDRAELGLEVDGGEVWSNIQADSEGCLGPRCAYWNTDCFVTLARRAAEEADLLVANHSLLFSDLTSNGKVLPEYGPLIIDEAHHVEHEATECFGYKITRHMASYLLSAAGHALRKLNGLAGISAGVFLDRMGGTEALLAQSRQDMFLFFDRLAESAWAGKDNKTLRLRFHPGEYFHLDEMHRKVAAGWMETAGMLASFAESLAEGGENWAVLASDFFRLSGSIRQMAGDINFFWQASEENYVYWIEGGQSHCTLRAAPIEVAGVLAGMLWDTGRAIVLTSATLSVDERFNHFAERTGLGLLPVEKTMFSRLDTPFDFQKQVLLAVTTDMPEREGKDYPGSLARAIYRLTCAAGGRTLVLFTSHSTLRDTYSKVKLELERDGISLIGHGIDGSRARLVDEFRHLKRAVLFGAYSFWEGVDIPGEALSMVILVKLPFSPPDDPVHEARLEALSRREMNGFYHLSLPEAVIRFKQGFGRLIRTARDRGVVVVLDGRLINRRYGNKFLSSLPGGLSCLQLDVCECAQKITGWLSG